MSVEALFVTAAVLLLIELFVPSAGLLTFGGFAAFCAGVIILLLSDATEFYGLSVEIVAAIGLLIFAIFAMFGYYVFKIYKRKTTTGTEAMIGDTATIKSWKGTSGIVTYEGEDWKAKSDSDFKKGDMVMITELNKMTLTVQKE